MEDDFNDWILRPEPEYTTKSVIEGCLTLLIPILFIILFWGGIIWLLIKLF